MGLRQQLDKLTYTFGDFKTLVGDHFFVKTWIENTGAADSFDTFSFTTPDSDLLIFAKAKLSPDGDILVQIFEDATITGGTPITAFNNNRNSSNTAGLAPLAGPTITDEGTESIVTPVGVAPGFNYTIIAKRNTTYAFKITKKTANDVIVDIDFWWFEHAIGI
jgi:hypothetical protein